LHDPVKPLVENQISHGFLLVAKNANGRKTADGDDTHPSDSGAKQVMQAAIGRTVVLYSASVIPRKSLGQRARVSARSGEAHGRASVALM
jgi:hypothetical protein